MNCLEEYNLERVCDPTIKTSLPSMVPPTMAEIGYPLGAADRLSGAMNLSSPADGSAVILEMRQHVESRSIFQTY